MSNETVTKKRGRPKKTDNVNPTAGKQDGEIVTTSKRSTTSRSITTSKASSKDVVQKKPVRRKKLADIDDVDATNEPLVDEINPRSTAKEEQFERGKQSSRSKILDEAKAFKELKASAAAFTQTGVSDDGKLETSSSGAGISEDSRSLPLRPARNSTTSGSPLPPMESSSPPSSSPSSMSAKNDTTRSSFLSGFLSDKPDSAPEAPESSKISDRSAFNSQSLSVDEIVSGTGVSDLASLTAAIEQKVNAKRERQSAIPINAPKSFKSHSLNAFPDKAQQPSVKAPSAQKYINPETYALGSFKSFKASPQAATAPSSPTLNSSSTAPSTKQSPHIPPTSTLSQTQSKSQPTQSHQKATIQTSSSPTPSNSPHPSSPIASTQTSTPTPTTFPTRPLPSTPPPTSSQPQPPPPTFRPKRPTEMTPAELLKNPEFKSLRRKYTGLIVGIPVLVVTSWLLWDRMDREDKGVSLGEVSVVDERRKRGELPRRILDDGGLERGR